MPRVGRFAAGFDWSGFWLASPRRSSFYGGLVRVLIVSAPMLGHVFPLVPLGRALAEAGHEVLVATAAEALRVRESGLAVHDALPGYRFGPIAARMLLRHPLLSRAQLAGTTDPRGVGILFGAVNDRMADGVVAVARRWRPDLVVYEPLAVAGALAAAGIGVPAVLHETTLFGGPSLVAATASRLGDALRRHPVGDLPPPAAVLTIAPASVAGTRDGWPMRAVPYGADQPLPGWLTEQPSRARVLVSRSTVPQPGPDRLMRRVIDAAGPVDADFVLIRPDRRAAARRYPPNVRATDWLPLPAALAVSTAIVHHGGAGSTLAALHAGVPQLVVRGAGDRRHNAELVAVRGAGLAVDDREISTAVLDRLLDDPALARAAQQVSAEVAAMPAPADLVPRLTELILSQR